MQNETSVIIFASNLPPSIKRAVRFKLFYSSYVQQIKQSTSNATLQVISAYSNKDIINALIEHKDRIVIFHFEGRSSNLN